MKQVTFIDSAKIKIKGGNGGNGAKGWHREKYVNQGGPSGGDGGNGGSVIFIADNNENTLLDFKGRSLYEGENGGKGLLQNMTGKKGKDVIIKVPVGTTISSEGLILADLSFHGQIWVGAQGGRGGRGNASFKSPKNPAPELYEHGEIPQWKNLELELKVLADVGLLGYPNAGKSSLVSTISNAKPKIADYAFTTLVPQLGMVKHGNNKFVVTDLPGLIEGASEGKGMGHQFLKHLSRTKLILHLIDITSEDIANKYKTLRKELKQYSEELNKLPEIVVFTKIDELEKPEMEKILKKHSKLKPLLISSFTRDGISKLLDVVSIKLNELRDLETKQLEELSKENEEYKVFRYKKPQDHLTIEKEDNIFTIYSNYAYYWANRIPLTTQENIIRIYKKFENKGYIKQMQSQGLKQGDIIKVKDTPFTIEFDSEYLS